MEVLIVGAGEMGRWFGRTVTSHYESVDTPDEDGIEIAYGDRDREVAEQAAAALGDPARGIPLDSTERFDLVCIAVPIPAAPAAIEAHAGRARSAIVDVTGEMTTPLEAMAEHTEDCERAGLHPLFSAENAPGPVAIAVDDGGPTIDTVRGLLEAGGNSLVETTPAEHDEAMETIQAAAHSAVLSYALAAEAVPDGFETPVSATLEALVDRVTGNDARVYADIQSTFDGADRVAAAAERLASADRETFEALYRQAGTASDGSESSDAGEAPVDDGSTVPATADETTDPGEGPDR